LLIGMPICTSTRYIRLIDVENLTGSATVTSKAAALVAAAVSSTTPTGENDLTIVATSHRNGLAAGLAHPGARLLWKSGLDGADQALAAAFVDQPLLNGFTGVVIGSGDGYFVGVAAEAHARGLRVTVVARPDALSHRLAAVADEITLLNVAA